jgi:hypothetical protein
LVSELCEREREEEEAEEREEEEEEFFLCFWSAGSSVFGFCASGRSDLDSKWVC